VKEWDENTREFFGAVERVVPVQHILIEHNQLAVSFGRNIAKVSRIGVGRMGKEEETNGQVAMQLVDLLWR
jgi:hypothetical protein